MKIDLTYNDLSTKFGDLNLGDTFAHCDMVYIKIVKVKDTLGYSYNAVRLTTGSFAKFEDCDSVSNVRVVAHTEVM